MLQVPNHLLREIRSTPPPAVRIDLVILPVAPVKEGIVLEISSNRPSFCEEVEKEPCVAKVRESRAWFPSSQGEEHLDRGQQEDAGKQESNTVS
jgi:hypothetical protein